MGSDISINAIRSDLEQISKKLTPAYEIWMESSEGETGAADLPEWIPTYLQSDLKQTEKKLHQYRNDVLTASRTTQGRSPWSKRQKRRVGILELYENCIFMHSALHIATRMASGASIEPTSVHQYRWSLFQSKCRTVLEQHKQAALIRGDRARKRAEEKIDPSWRALKKSFDRLENWGIRTDVDDAYDFRINTLKEVLKSKSAPLSEDSYTVTMQKIRKKLVA